MSEQLKERCQALTKAGNQCKNKAQIGSRYCHIHQAQAEEAIQAAPEPPPPPEEKGEIDEEQMGELLSELDELVAELQKQHPEYDPPPFSPTGMVRMISKNLEPFKPEVQLAILQDLRDSLQGASAKDLANIETWKGMWYLLNYSIQTESSAFRERVMARLSQLPGGNMMAALMGLFEGSSPRDLLDPETWKGFIYVLNYTVKLQAEEVKVRLLGRENEETVS